VKVGGVMEDGDATQKECEDSDNNGKCCKREKRVDAQSGSHGVSLVVLLKQLRGSLFDFLCLAGQTANDKACSSEIARPTAIWESVCTTTQPSNGHDLT